MRLYHTGNIRIQVPDLHIGRKNADLGQGFYMTPDREFTYRWAGPESVVNEYELDESGLMIHRFTRSEAWFQYIFENRRAGGLSDCLCQSHAGNRRQMNRRCCFLLMVVAGLPALIKAYAVASGNEITQYI